MWLRRGHSEGRNVHASSRALACQYSDSYSFSFFMAGFIRLPLSCSKKRISVDMQKYETVRTLSFSRKASLFNSASSLFKFMKSFI